MTLPMDLPLLHWYAVLGHEDEILERLDTVQVSRKIWESVGIRYSRLTILYVLCISDLFFDSVQKSISDHI